MKDEKEEVDKINAKDKLSEMIGQYQNLVFSICIRMTQDYFVAEDLTQETFLSAFRSLSEFDGTNEKTWLCKIATNKCLDYCKAAARREVASEDNVFEEQTSPNESLERDYLEKEMWESLERKCRSLGPPYDEVAVRYFVKEQNAQEIAMETGINVKTIQTQVYRARAMLRRIYNRKEQI